MQKTNIKDLAAATGLSYRALASLLDTDERSLSRWLSGERKPRHPAMLRRALQLIVLEQRGVITDKLIVYTNCLPPISPGSSRQAIVAISCAAR